MSDDASGEMQLRGKQLVFYGMAGTVVAVAIFLSGVLVGRGVPSARSAAQPTIAADDPSVRPDEPVDVAAAAANTPAAPLEYPEIVGDGKVSEKPLRRADTSRQPFAAAESGSKPPARPIPPVVTTAVAKAPGVDKAPAAAKAPAAERPAVATTTATTRPLAPSSSETRRAAGAANATSTPSSNGRYLVQVAAYRRPADASAIEARLKGKGYPVFVAPASTARGTLYRVRVGGYETEREALNVANRLKKEEKLKPWVIR